LRMGVGKRCGSVGSASWRGERFGGSSLRVEAQRGQMINSVIACAVLMKLSMTTKLEMARVFPEVASYCMTHPSGKVRVSYRFGGSRRSSRPGGRR
jgi:hypothetical protein